MLSEQLVDQTIIHYGTKADSLLYAGDSLVTARRMGNQTPAAQPAHDQAADADIEPMAAKMKAIERGAKALQIGTKSQTISLVPIIALTAAAVMSRRGTGYYPTVQRELDDNRPMTAEQAETLKRLAKAAYELDAFKPNLTRAEADRRIAALSAKLKLLDGPPHIL